MSVGYYTLSPEVAGGLGEGTVVDNSVHPPHVQRLHYEMEGWLGDDLLESFPCFIVTARVKDALLGLGASGFTFDSVEVSKSPTFEELHPGRKLPAFFWLKVQGRAGADDLGLSQDHRLVVSRRVLDVLRSLDLANCDVSEYSLAI
jgi:hypothetical protein